MLKRHEVDALVSFLNDGGTRSDSLLWEAWNTLAIKSAECCELPEDKRLFTKEDLVGDYLKPANEAKAAESRARKIDGINRKSLTNYLDQRIARYHSHVREQGHGSSLALRTSDGRGRGLKTYFYLVSELLPEPEAEHESDPNQYSYPRTIRWAEKPYSDIQWSRQGRGIFDENGIRKSKSFKGVRFKYGPVWNLALILAIGCLGVIYFWFTGQPLNTQHLAGLIIYTPFFYFVWDADIRPRRRLMIAGCYLIDETFLKSEQPTVLIETRRTDEGYRTRAVRYGADCPICGAPMELTSGREAWPGRIVGRCADSAEEHVYSFDRLTLTGEALRIPPDPLLIGANKNYKHQKPDASDINFPNKSAKGTIEYNPVIP